MNLTYPAKQRLVLHFAEKGSWNNEYDDDLQTYLMDRVRSKKIGYVTLQESESGKRFRIDYSPASASKDATQQFLMNVAHGPVANRSQPVKTYINIIIHDNKVYLKDESGRQISFSVNTPISDLESSDDKPALIQEREFLDITHRAGSETIEIPALGAVVCFARNGHKAIYFENTHQAISFEKPTSYKDSPFLFGGLMNTIVFDEHFGRDIGLDLKTQFLDPAKLVVAVDLGVEPGIKLMNKLDPEKAFELLAYLIDRRERGEKISPSEADYDIAQLQENWHDTVDFKGYAIAPSRKFGIVKGGDTPSFIFKFSAESKASLIAQGRILKHAKEHDLPSTHLLQKNPALTTLLHVLEHNGQNIHAHYQQPETWKVIVLESPKAPEIARNARQMMIDHFGEGFAERYVSCISFESDKCIIAVEAEALEKIALAHRATIHAMSLIKDGSHDAALFKTLLDQGADLKYTDPKAAQSGKSFANYLKAKDNKALLNVLQSAQGIRDIHDTPALT